METETSQCLSLYSPPPQNPEEQYIGCFVTLITKWDNCFAGVISGLSFQNLLLRVQNVGCYWRNGFQSMPLHIFEYIDFYLLGLKIVTCHNVPLISNENLENPEKPQATTDYDASLVTRPVYDGLHIASNPFVQPQFPGSNFFDPWSMPYNLLNQAPIYDASNPQYLPYGSLTQAPIYNASNPQYLPYGSLIQAPIYNASNPQYGALNQAPIYNALNPQYGALNQAPIYNVANPQSMPCGLLDQDPIYNGYESELMPTPTNTSDLSFFSDPSPTRQFSIQPANGGFAMNENFKKYEIWGHGGFAETMEKNFTKYENYENKNQRDDGACNPLDHIESPYNPYGHLERLLDYVNVF